MAVSRQFAGGLDAGGGRPGDCVRLPQLHLSIAREYGRKVSRVDTIAITLATPTNTGGAHGKSRSNDSQGQSPHLDRTGAEGGRRRPGFPVGGQRSEAGEPERYGNAGADH